MKAEPDKAQGDMVIIYDGQCAFCRRSISRIRRRDRDDQFVYLPRDTRGLETRYPQITQGDFDTGMRLIGPDGTLYVGADAIHKIASHLPYYRRFTWLYRVPIVHQLARGVYGWIAAHRLKLSQYCSDGQACRIDPPADAQ